MQAGATARRRIVEPHLHDRPVHAVDTVRVLLLLHGVEHSQTVAFCELLLAHLLLLRDQLAGRCLNSAHRLEKVWGQACILHLLLLLLLGEPDRLAGALMDRDRVV